MLNGDPPDDILQIQSQVDEGEPGVQYEELSGMQEIDSGMAVIKIGPDIEVRGRRITHIRKYPDGTRDIIYAES